MPSWSFFRKSLVAVTVSLRWTAGMSSAEKIRFSVRRIVSRRAMDERSPAGRTIAVSLARSPTDRCAIARSWERVPAFAGSFRTCALIPAQTAFAARAQAAVVGGRRVRAHDGRRRREYHDEGEGKRPERGIDADVRPIVVLRREERSALFSRS